MSPVATFFGSVLGFFAGLIVIAGSDPRTFYEPGILVTACFVCLGFSFFTRHVLIELAGEDDDNV